MRDRPTKSLAYYAEIARAVPRIEFERRFSYFALVVMPFSPATDLEFKTIQGPRALGGSYSVFPVLKRAGSNAFLSMITVGRAQNNDIFLQEPSVSKFHAYFKLANDGALELADGNSSYGTYLEGERLEPPSNVRVSAGANLRFGDVEAILCSPATLYDLARRTRNHQVR